MSIHLCVFNTRAGPLRRELDQAPAKQFLASVILSGLDDSIWNGFPRQSLDGLSIILCSEEFSLFFLLLEFHLVCELYLDYSELLG